MRRHILKAFILYFCLHLTFLKRRKSQKVAILKNNLLAGNDHVIDIFTLRMCGCADVSVLSIQYLFLYGQFNFNSFWMWFGPHKASINQSNLNRQIMFFTISIASIVTRCGIFFQPTFDKPLSFFKHNANSSLDSKVQLTQVLGGWRYLRIRNI